jgi:hypothetical protein
MVQVAEEQVGHDGEVEGFVGHGVYPYILEA